MISNLVKITKPTQQVNKKIKKIQIHLKLISVAKYDDLRKELVLHSASAFNDKNLNSYLCLETLTNLIYLITQGESFSKTEKENLFFNVTKLLHSNQNELKRMIFIFITHLKSIDNYFILTGPLLNEINGENVFLKTTSLRTIGHIIDLSNIAVVERHLKTVDLLSLIFFFKIIFFFNYL